MSLPPETDKVWLYIGEIIFSYKIQSAPHESEFFKSKNFIDKVDLSGNIMEQYQQYLKDTGKATSKFSDYTLKAGNVLKSFGAAIGSITVNWTITQIISLAATAIDNYIHRVEKAKETMDEVVGYFVYRKRAVNILLDHSFCVYEIYTTLLSLKEVDI